VRPLEKVGRSHLATKKNLLKIRLLAENPALHSEVDRPDAEATFRTALWAPLSAVIFYVSLTISAWWSFALVLPLALVAQSRLLRREANDALITSLVASDALSKDVLANVQHAWDHSPDREEIADAGYAVP
jgi:hypothetical protein